MGVNIEFKEFLKFFQKTSFRIAFLLGAILFKILTLNYSNDVFKIIADILSVLALIFLLDDLFSRLGFSISKKTKHQKIKRTLHSLNKSQVLVYDLSWYDLGKKHNLDYKSTFTLQQAIEGKEYRQDFSELIKMMNEAEHLIYIGEAHKGLDFDLFIDDFSTSVVITDDENIQLKETDYLKVIRGISLERVKALLDVTKLALEPFNISYEKPFDDELLKKVKEIWEDRTKRKKHFMEVIDAKSVKKINEIYPFTKELPDIVSEALWNVYAKDTTRASLIDRPQREDFFIDIVLMYTLFDWKSPNEYLTKRPKVSLLKAVTEANKRDIMRFHNLIKKNSFIDKAIN